MKRISGLLVVIANFLPAPIHASNLHCGQRVVINNNAHRVVQQKQVVQQRVVKQKVFTPDQLFLQQNIAYSTNTQYGHYGQVVAQQVIPVAVSPSYYYVGEQYREESRVERQQAVEEVAAAKVAEVLIKLYAQGGQVLPPVVTTTPAPAPVTPDMPGEYIPDDGVDTGTGAEPVDPGTTPANPTDEGLWVPEGANWQALKGIVEYQCLHCHSGSTAKKGFRLDVNLEKVPAKQSLLAWYKVLKREMPPANNRPADHADGLTLEEVDTFEWWFNKIK